MTLGGLSPLIDTTAARAYLFEDCLMRCAVFLSLGLLTATSAWADPAPSLNGRWIVDLSAEPGVPYTKLMDLLLGADGSVSGSFYDSRIEGGRWKTSRARTCVSFRTTDDQGPYHTAACLVGDRVSGQTWAEHRTFLFNWDAVRPAP